jgi:hypothetical protein
VQSDAYQRAFPSANADFVCATLKEKFGFSKIGIAQIYFDFVDKLDQLFANATDIRVFLSYSYHSSCTVTCGYLRAKVVEISLTTSGGYIPSRGSFAKYLGSSASHVWFHAHRDRIILDSRCLSVALRAVQIRNLGRDRQCRMHASHIIRTFLRLLRRGFISYSSCENIGSRDNHKRSTLTPLRSKLLV